LKQLHAHWGDAVHFVDVLVRQEHPGPAAPAYMTYEQKCEDARRYGRIEGIPWAVLVDDVAGTVHRAYGALAAAAFLIDSDGRVAFVSLVPHAPTLHRAINTLLAQNGRGVVLGGLDRTPHVLAPITDGWRALQRGMPQSIVDLMTAIPGAPLVLWLGHRLRPLLAPVALRATPLPAPARVAFAAAAAGGIGIVLWRASHRTRVT